jgi:DNA (cytosine-5)-methyltransferase 1
LVIDLCGGPGGWDVGARMIGMPDPVGLEIDAAACATRAAAGLRTIRTDIARFPVSQLTGLVWGLIGSPPCLFFSAAGTRAGVHLTHVLSTMIRDQFAGQHTLGALRRQMARELLASGWLDGPPARPEPAEWRAKRQAGWLRQLRARRAMTRTARLRAVNARPRGYFTRAERQERAWAAVRSASLVAEPGRYMAACWPEWIALEQVPEVLPLWRVYATELRARGYHTWTGVLNAADYGVPQTRRRAILIASRKRRVTCPPATHYDPRDGMALFGEPWVSMADALQFGATGVPAPSVTAGGTRTGGAEPFGHRARDMLAGELAAGRWIVDPGSGGHAEGWTSDVENPSPTIRHQTESWVMRRQVSGQRAAGRRDHPLGSPAPTITGGGSAAGSGNGTGLEWVLQSGQPVYGEGRAIRDLAEPATTVTSTVGRAAWTQTRPATTVLGEGRIGRPGHKGRERGGEAHFAVDSVRVTVAQAATLQSFPDGYPWQGNSGRQYEQVGNAVPPRLAAHVLAEATGVPAPVATPLTDEPADPGTPVTVRTSFGMPAGDRVGNHLINAATQPAHTVTSKIRSWQVQPGAPAEDPAFSARAESTETPPTA